MVGIREVARQAGVSATTVSRLLNEDETLVVMPETRERILKVVKDLDYQFDKKKKVKHTLAIVTPISEEEEIEDPYFRAIHLAILKKAKEQKIKVKEIFRINGQKALPNFSNYGAVIVIGHIAHEKMQQLQQQNSHIIVVDDPFAEGQFDYVGIDLESATRQQLDRLYEKGHRRIAFVGGYRKIAAPAGIEIKKDEVRLTAYLRWMKEHQLETYNCIYLGDWTPLDGMALTEDLIRQRPADLPTAIMAASDPIAVGIYRGLAKHQLKIPQQVAVVSFDNIEVSGFLNPPLSTVDLKTAELGERAAVLAIERIRGHHIKFAREILTAEICKRDSE